MGVYIDIALSLVFIYLVLSLVISAVNELVSMWLRKRPAMLAKSILSLIDDEELWKGFYDAGNLINPALAAKGESQADWTASSPATAEQPAKSGPTNDPQSFKAKLDWHWQWGLPTRGQTEGHASFIDGASFARALTTSVLKRTATDGKLPSSYVFDDVEKALKALERLPVVEKSQIRDVLVTAAANAKDAENKLDAFEKQLGSWFDRAQDRVTGEYTRWAKSLTLIMGAVLVILTNTDTVRIAGELRVNEAARTALVASALNAVDSESGKPVEVNCRPKGVEDGAELNETQMAAAEKCLRGQIQLFGALGPRIIGWENDPVGVAVASWDEGISGNRDLIGNVTNVLGNVINILGHAINKILGLLITICAISLGAPFWFDMLSKVVNIRAAGLKPDSSSKAQP